MRADTSSGTILLCLSVLCADDRARVCATNARNSGMPCRAVLPTSASCDRNQRTARPPDVARIAIGVPACYLCFWRLFGPPAPTHVDRTHRREHPSVGRPDALAARHARITSDANPRPPTPGRRRFRDHQAHVAPTPIATNLPLERMETAPTRRCDSLPSLAPPSVSAGQSRLRQIRSRGSSRPRNSECGAPSANFATQCSRPDCRGVRACPHRR